LFFSRNFNFRVKSIGQAKFTKEEVQKVQEGGNEVLILSISFILK